MTTSNGFCDNLEVETYKNDQVVLVVLDAVLKPSCQTGFNRCCTSRCLENLFYNDNMLAYAVVYVYGVSNQILMPLGGSNFGKTLVVRSLEVEFELI